MSNGTSRTTGGTGSRGEGASDGDRAGSGRAAAAGSVRRSPSLTEVFRAQLRLVFRRRWSLAALAVLTALPMTVMAASLQGVSGVTLSDLVRGTWAWPAVLALVWPIIAAWRDDAPSERAYHWTLPMDRSRLQLLRAAAGWVHLVAGLAAGIALGWATGASIHDWMAPGQATVLAAVVPSATVMYLVGTLPAVTTDRPLLWLVVAYLAVVALQGLAMTRGWGWLETGLAEVFTSGPLSLNAVSQAVSSEPGGNGVAGSPWRAVALWLAVTAGLTVAAARLHLERLGEG